MPEPAWADQPALARLLPLFDGDVWRAAWRPGAEVHLYAIGCTGLGRLAAGTCLALAKLGTCAVSCYSSLKERGIGVFLGSLKTSALALEIGHRLERDRDAITEEIGLSIKWSRTSEGKVQVAASKAYTDLQGSTTRQDQIDWFRTTINAFIDALRPRIAAIAKEFIIGGDGAF